MCTVLLSPVGNPIAVNKYIISTFDNGTPIVQEDSRDMILPTKTKFPPACTTAKRVQEK